MKLTRVWKRVIAQGMSLSLFGLIITLSAESVPEDMPASVLACEDAREGAVDLIVIDQEPVVIRVSNRAGPGWRALIPGVTLPRT